MYALILLRVMFCIVSRVIDIYKSTLLRYKCWFPSKLIDIRRKTNALGKWDGNRDLSETVNQVEIRTNLHIKQVFVRIEIGMVNRGKRYVDGK
jgi:hypothetical protein